MEELIKAVEDVMRLQEDLDEANDNLLALSTNFGPAWDFIIRMFNEVPETFVYTSKAGDSYLVKVDIEEGDIMSVMPISTVNHRDEAIKDVCAFDQKVAQ